MPFRRAAARVYSEASGAVVGSLLLFAALNLLSLALLQGQGERVTQRYGRETIRSVYPGMDEADVDLLLEESWTRPVAYEPFVQYKEAPFSGRFVNVSPAGFRESAEQGPWPPAPEHLNVFVFGGSTIFGYGVPDHQTVPSYLQALLGERLPHRSVRCYNFGGASYYSSQERILFAELLAAGHRPDVAIFVDGINEFLLEEPLHSPRLRGLLEGRPGVIADWAVSALPLTKLVHWALGTGDEKKPALLDASLDVPELLDARIERYLANVRLAEGLAEAEGVLAVFVVQPTPTYRYDPSFHPFARWGFGRHSRSAFGYPRLAERLRREPPRGALVWAADIQEDLREPLYVDLVHYNPRLARRLAAEIVDQMAERSLLDGIRSSIR